MARVGGLDSAGYLRALELLPRLAQMSADELAAWVRQLREAAPPGDPTLLAAAARLARLAPLRALPLAAERNRHGVRDQHLLQTVFDVLAGHEREAVDQWLATLGPSDRRALEARWLRSLSVQDQAAALALLARRPGAPSASVTLPAGLLAETSIPEALAAALALPQAAHRTEALGAVLKVWVAQDPGAALVWLQARPELAGFAQLFGTLAEGLAARDPRRAAELAATQLPEERRVEVLQRLVGVWKETDLAGAIAWTRQQAEPLREELLRKLLPDWAQRDLHGLVQFIQQEAGGGYGQSVLHEALEQWGKADAEGFRAWVRQLPAGPLRAQALHIWASPTGNVQEARDQLELFRGLSGELTPAERRLQERALAVLAAVDVEAAFAWARAESLPEQRDRWLRAVVVGAAASAPAQAAELLRGIERSGPLGSRSYFEHLEMLAQVAQFWVAADPAAAARWAAERPAGPERQRVLGAVAERWARRDLAAAWSWAGSLEAEPGQAEIRASVLRIWAGSDAAAALAAASRLPAGQLGHCLPVVLPRLAEVDPARAAALAVQLTPDRHLLGQIAEAWLERDPRAARAWIETIRSELDSSTLQRLLGGGGS